MHYVRRIVLGFTVITACVVAGNATAQREGDLGPAPLPGGQAETEEGSRAADVASDTPQSFVDILLAGGPIGFLIVAVSIVALALAIEHILSLRRSVLLPDQLGEQVRTLLDQGNATQAIKICRQQPSLLAHVLHAGLAEIQGGWSQIEKAVEDALAEQSARLFRKIEYLSMIGNIAPMLGLLGTVIGMIFAFREVANTQGAARAADLAEGIYLALVTTVEGLIVAIPALAAYAVFRNRVDHMVAEATFVSQHSLAPLKQYARETGAEAASRGGA